LTERNITIDYESCEMDDYDDEEYIDKDNSDGCHKVHMTNTTIQEKYGSSVRPCCGFHGYLANGHCMGKDDKGTEYRVDNMKVCHDHTLETSNHVAKVSLDCPKHCNLIGAEFVNQPVLKKGMDGKLVLKLEEKTLEQFCFGYECSSDRGAWVTTYEACECKDMTQLTAELQSENPGIPLCCGLTGTLHVADQTCYEDEKKIPVNETDSKGAYQCSWKSKEEFQIVHKKEIDKSGPKPTCIGIIKSPKETFPGSVVCTAACGGKDTCFESCNMRGKCWTGNDYADCETKKSYSDIIGLPVEDSDGNGNIQYGDRGQIPCHKIAPNYETQQIYPDDNCHDSAEFSENGDLFLPGRNITLHYKEFCVTPTVAKHEKGRYMIQVCLPKKETKTKFSFYFIILSISITCLLITILVYVVFHKALLRSSYNKIMLNFATSLLLAFLILVINQNHGSDFSKICCTILGHFNQFFFLATFTWMTIMSYEIFKQIHGMSHMIGGHNSNSILKQILVGYGVPLLIVVLTLIVELSAPRCASYNPRFGHKSCLFFGKLDKFLWLYGPILLMLVINTVMFIYITINVVKNQKTGATDSMKTGSRKEKLDKICLYLRLFLGMGVIWYFELLSFATSSENGSEEWSYFTDCLNMLQGVWVFITFVCKRNVLKVVMRRTDRLYSGIVRTKSSLSPNPEKASFRNSPKTEDYSLTSVNT